MRVSGGEEFVLMPVDAARAAQQRLNNVPPEHWGLAIGSPRYAGRRQHIVELYVDGAKAGVSFLATRRSWNLLNDQNVACLLGGREKRADALLRLCHNVTVKRQGGEVTFTYNNLRRNGSVVRRTIHARVAGRRLELLRLETVELRGAGTFSYPDLI